ncbi:DUF2894 domain-containing protein [Cupriavidus sp. UYPR2.512]|uniref:DUF2894 domain-containing protein n=1 Tax=Cupriavidus sp. UYPR2.512 TaxID=1080187 RepID=UPI00036C45D1|nr:DUF2894 domain-containing protein [Cupriavidus sp. UYPR2.512]UIF89776.1 DUF2894 domain-containing protein [Cupriavidus necator]
MASVDVAADIRAQLHSWQASGADQADPVRFRLMQALARRSAGHSGAVRALLDERLRGLVAAYAAIVQRYTGQDREVADGAAPSTPTSGPTSGPMASPTASPTASALGALVHDITARARPAVAVASNDARSHTPVPAHAPQSDAPLVDALADYFRETWARVSVEQHFRLSLERVPENAGPLNTDHLVHRSLSLMRETSPGYLRHFLSYVEGMSWLEQLGAAAAAEKEAARAAAAKKSVRGKARK